LAEDGGRRQDDLAEGAQVAETDREIASSEIRAKRSRKGSVERIKQSKVSQKVQSIDDLQTVRIGSIAADKADKAGLEEKVNEGRTHGLEDEIRHLFSPKKEEQLRRR
jgi:hypothetical protein